MFINFKQNFGNAGKIITANEVDYKHQLMPENWKTYKLSDISEIIMGQSPKGVTTNNLGEGLPLLNGPTEFGYSHPTPTQFTVDPKKVSQIGDLLFCVRGSTTGRMNFSDQPYAIGRGIGAFRGKNGFSTKYVKYIIDFYLDRMLAICTGSTFPNLSRSDLENFNVKSCSPKESNAIASILSALDDKIELNLRMNKILEEMAMALYKHWFVDFGPFQDGEFVESELGEIPKGWEVKTLGDLFKIKHGFAFKGKHFQLEEREELLLTPGNFQASGGIKFNWGKQKFYSAEFPNDYILTKGDLIIALTDLTQSCDILGAPAIIPDNDYKYLHNQRLGLVTDLLPQFSNEFIYCITNSSNFRAFIRNSKTGSTVSHTSPTRIYDYKMALPSQGLENNFKEELENLLELTFTNSSENKTLTQLRDTLLPKLISGEVRVKDVEKTLSEVL